MELPVKLAAEEIFLEVVENSSIYSRIIAAMDINRPAWCVIQWLRVS